MFFSKTAHRIHFDDLNGVEFERLVYAFVLRQRKWDSLEWMGQVGGDNGIDIWGRFEGKSYCYQCANYRSLTFAKIKADITKVIAAGKIPNYYIVICGGSISARTRDAIRRFAHSHKLSELTILSGVEFEEALRHHDRVLLRRFFNGDTFPELPDDFRDKEGNLMQLQSTHHCQIVCVPYKASPIFEGRAEILEELINILSGGKNIALSATVEGIGGIGKTELVLHLIYHERIQSYFQHIIWIDGSSAIEDQWLTVAQVLDIQLKTASIRANIEIIESFLIDKGNALIIIDNAHKWHEISSVAPMKLPLLITTRTHDFGGNSFTHKCINFLSDESARKMLLAIEPSLINDPQLASLLNKLGGHALSIELAGLCIKTMFLNAAAYLERLDRFEEEPDIVLEKTKYLQTVNACLHATWTQLSESAKLLWIYASLFAPTVVRKKLLNNFCSGYKGIASRIEELLGTEKKKYARENNATSKLSSENIDKAFSELCMYGIISRVLNEHGQELSWHMHRIVRDFTHNKVNRFHRVWYLLNFSEWLQHQRNIKEVDLPHIVNAVIEAHKHLVNSQDEKRNLAVEISHFGFRDVLHDVLFDPMRLFRYIENKLNSPVITPILKEALRHSNVNVVWQALNFLSHTPYCLDYIEPLFDLQYSNISEIKKLATNHIVQISKSHLFRKEVNRGVILLLENSDFTKQTDVHTIIANSEAENYWDQKLLSKLTDENAHNWRGYRLIDYFLARKFIGADRQDIDQLILHYHTPSLDKYTLPKLLTLATSARLTGVVASFLLKVYESSKINHDKGLIISIFNEAEDHELRPYCWYLLNNVTTCDWKFVMILLLRMQAMEKDIYHQRLLNLLSKMDEIGINPRSMVIDIILNQRDKAGLDILLSILQNSHVFFEDILKALTAFQDEHNRTKIALGILDNYLHSIESHVFLLPLLKALISLRYTEALPLLESKLKVAKSHEIYDIKQTVESLHLLKQESE